MFYFDEFCGKKVLKSSLLEGLEHFFTTRDFVLTKGALDELEQTANKNREIMLEAFAIKPERLITVNQTHSDNVEIYTGQENFYDNCDGIITSDPETAVILNFADCVPVILFDKENNIASVVHAGWRGTAKEIVKKAALIMVEKLGSNPRNISAAIGPSIGIDNFSVDEKVFFELVKDNDNSVFRYDKKLDKYYVDLKLLNKKQLLSIGVENIDLSTYCTYSMSDIFFSYRKEEGITARHSAVIKLGKRD